MDISFDGLLLKTQNFLSFTNSFVCLFVCETFIEG